MATDLSDSPVSRRIGVLLPAVLVGLSLLFALGLAEATLRLLGFEPWQRIGVWAANSQGEIERPLMTEPHPVRGWANRPGAYEYPGYSDAVASIKVNIKPDGSRHVGPAPAASDAPALLFVGGSNTMGWAISDWETFPWKLQARYPQLQVHNFGVPGYSSLQSLLTMEEQLPQLSGRKIVFYGLIGHHFSRNVLNDNWMQLFAAPDKGQMPPYVTVASDGSLQRHAPFQWQPWPLKDRLALANAAENAFIKLAARQRSGQTVPAMHGLLQAMETVAAAGNAQLVVLLLKIDSRRAGELENFLAAEGIRALNCSPAEYGPEYQVTGEGHPNDLLNTLWADCVGDYLDAEFLTPPLSAAAGGPNA